MTLEQTFWLLLTLYLAIPILSWWVILKDCRDKERRSSLC